MRIPFPLLPCRFLGSFQKVPHRFSLGAAIVDRALHPQNSPCDGVGFFSPRNKFTNRPHGLVMPQGDLRRPEKRRWLSAL